MSLSLNERAFVKKAMLEGLRTDKRTLDMHRELHIEFGQDRGHVLVHLGHTKVLAVVTAQVTRPFPDRPLEGSLNIYVNDELATHDQTDSDDGHALGRLLERLFKSCRTVDTESLCILPGEKVWTIRLDLHVLEDAGNVLDAASMASLAALLDFRRPDSTVIDGQAVIYSTEEKHPVPLTIQYHPVSVTFGIFDLSEGTTSSHSNAVVQVAVDPSRLEEQVANGRITITLNRQGEIVSLVKVGGPGLDSDTITQHCLGLAKSRSASLADTLNALLKDRK